MFKLNKIAALSLSVLFGISAAVAQPTQGEPVSDQEVELFASAVQQVQLLNQQAQGQMMEALEEQGLDAQRYTEIQQAQQATGQESSVTPEEMQKYEVATEAIQAIQQRAQKEMEAKIVELGLTIERYQEITMAVQRDPELQQKIQEKMSAEPGMEPAE